MKCNHPGYIRDVGHSLICSKCNTYHGVGKSPRPHSITAQFCFPELKKKLSLQSRKQEHKGFMNTLYSKSH